MKNKTSLNAENGEPMDVNEPRPDLSVTDPPTSLYGRVRALEARFEERSMAIARELQESRDQRQKVLDGQDVIIRKLDDLWTDYSERREDAKAMKGRMWAAVGFAAIAFSNTLWSRAVDIIKWLKGI